MSFHTLHRVSVDVMLVLASIVLSLDVVGENALSPWYPAFVALTCVATFFLVDRRRGPGLPAALSNALAAGSVVLFVAELAYDLDYLVLVFGHWLIYLTMIKLVLPKTPRDDWELLLLGLVQVVVGATLSQSDAVGVTLVAWAVTALWVLLLSHLQREAGRAAAAGVAALPESTGVDPYPGLIGPAFLLATARATAVTMALGVVIFLVTPRTARTDRNAEQSGSAATPAHATGFTDTVRLGQLGEILENDDVVMTVEILDLAGKSVEPPLELLWRGVTLIEYENRRWHRASTGSPQLPVGEEPPPPRALRRQKIHLEASDSHVLFALRPILWVVGEASPSPTLNPRDGSLYRQDYLERMEERDYVGVPPASACDYEVVSELDPAGRLPQPGEEYPNYRRDELLKIPQGLGGRLKAIADKVVADVPGDDPEAIGRALNSWLAREFHYTLQLDPVDSSIDPVEDFLINRKEGHCEYFASALTLLLRAEGVPARMVSGFKGGDWNGLTRSLTVRQKHAHTWVEALVGVDAKDQPLWQTFDPTPGSERRREIAKVGGFSSRFRSLSDFGRYVWLFYVVGFNAERQQRLLYAPLKRLRDDAFEGFEIMGAAAKGAFAWLVDLRGDLARALPRLAILLGVAALARLALSRAGRRAVRRLLGVSPGASADGSDEAVGTASFARAMRLLAELGLERPAAETPREFARRAAAVLAARGPRDRAVADVPARVVDLFYRARFGRLEPTPAALAHLESRLDALEACVHAPAAPAS